MGLYGKFTPLFFIFGVMVADDKVRIVVESGKFFAVYPGLLDELKLTAYIGVKTEEMQATLATVVTPVEYFHGIHRLGNGPAICSPAPDDSVSVRYRQGLCRAWVGFQHIPGVGSPGVSPYRRLVTVKI
jgi:hypothetical protein